MVAHIAARPKVRGPLYPIDAGCDIRAPRLPASRRARGPAAGGGSSNGRTADSDSASLGSNPSPPANLTHLHYCILRRDVQREIGAFPGVCGPGYRGRCAESHERAAVRVTLPEYLCRALIRSVFVLKGDVWKTGI